VQGLLTGKVTMESTYSSTDTRSRNRWFAPQRRKAVLDMLAGWKPLTEKKNFEIIERYDAGVESVFGVTLQTPGQMGWKVERK
jgi:hypothetical protein